MSKNNKNHKFKDWENHDFENEFDNNKKSFKKPKSKDKNQDRNFSKGKRNFNTWDGDSD